MDSLEGYVTYDALAADVLRQRGWEVEFIPWRRTEDWSRFATVVLRSPWDYQKYPDEFLEVLERIDASGTLLLNPLAVVRWNIVKTYLLDLEQRGVPIIPSVVGTALRAADLPLLAEQLGSDEIVVKPTISANADGTFRLRAPFSDEVTAAALAHHRQGQYIAQPFLRSIVEDGEISLFYFNGRLSHAIHKAPKPGDFRVQEEHGGILTAISPTAEARGIAHLALEAIGHDLLYARIDLARRPDGTWGLMEAELIEPSLYFQYDEGSPARFADALEERLSGNQ